MKKNSERICVFFRSDELELFNELCKRKGYFRTTFIREVLKLCTENNFSSLDLWEVLKDYKKLRSYVIN